MQSSRDRLETVLSRLAARADNESVFTKLYPEVARAAADAADARQQAGVRLGPPGCPDAIRMWRDVASVA